MNDSISSSIPKKSLKKKLSLLIIKTKENGSVHYEVDFDFIIKVEGEIDVQKPSEDPTIKQEDIVQEIDFELVQARPQIYYVDELRQILITRPSIQKIFSTTKSDTKGFPIYKCDFSIGVTAMKTP